MLASRRLTARSGASTVETPRLQHIAQRVDVHVQGDLSSLDHG